MYIIYVTKTNIKRYIIKSDKDYKPCSCVYQKVSEHESLYEAIETKQQLEKDAE